MSAAPATTTTIADQASPQIAPLQGMGKEISPRIVELEMSANKRDVNGFNTALKFAADTIKISPKIQLALQPPGLGSYRTLGCPLLDLE